MADFPLQFVLQVQNNMGSGISQATSQLKGLGDQATQTGQKAKSSGMGIGAAFQFTALNAFNLARSLIDTKRSYEDLAKAENAQINKHDAVTKATNRLQNAEINLAKARKSGDPAKIAKAENTVANAKLNVSRVTRAETLGQVELNRAHEDFYLNIIPNVISGLGTIFGLFQVMQGAGGIGGLIGALKKLFIPFAAISLVALAIKTNFLGFRDFLTNLGKDIGNAVPALKPFLNILQEVGELLGLLPSKGAKAGSGLNKAIADLKAQFGPIIDFFKNLIDDVMKGDWSGAFQRITDAAAEAWKQLKKAFPLLGEIDSLINKIENGNWKGAFLQIWKAATDVWNTIKTAVPFLGDIEAFIKALAAHKWDKVFAAVMQGWQDSGLPTLIENIFGVNWKAGLDAKFAEWTGLFGLFATSIKNQDWKGAFGAITQAAKDSGFQGLMDSLIKPQVSSAVNFVSSFISMIADQIIAMTSAVASTDVPTSLKSFMDAVVSTVDWVGVATNMVTTFFMAIGAYLITNFSEPLTQLFAVTLKLAFSGQTAMVTMTNAAIDIVNTFTEALLVNLNKFFTTYSWLPNAKIFTDNFQKALDKSRIPKLKVPTPPTQEELNKLAQTTMGGVQIGINGQPRPLIKVDSDTSLAHQKAKAITNSINRMHATIKISVQMMQQARNIVASTTRLPHMAAGFHGIVTGPTAFMAGERGAEKVDVTTRADMMTQKKSSDKGSNGPTTIIVYSVLDGRIIAESVANRINQNQAVYK